MLGEGLGLLGVVVIKMLAVMLFAAALTALPCFLADWILYGRDVPCLARKEDKGVGAGGGKILWAWLFLAFLGIGFGRGWQAQKDCLKERELGLEGERLEVSGTVRSLSQKDASWVLVLEDCAVHGREEGQGSPGRIQVYLEPEERPRPRLGSRIWVAGQISAYKPARNPGEFDYRAYYRSLKLNYRIFGDQWQILDGEYDVCRDGLYELSLCARRILDQVAEPEDAGIFRAAILGEKSGMDEEVRDLYQKSGISHLLAISGLHLSLISGAAYGTLRKLGLGYGKAGLVGGGLLVGYAVMAGAPTSVIRALIMALCGFLAAYLGRTYDLLSALGLSALLLLWDNPYGLCQSGVQLSFGAVAGIGGLGPWLARGLWEPRGGRGLGKILIVSLAMQLLTLPIVLYHFFQAPLYGVVLNLIVVPLMGIVIASGTAAILLGSFSLPLGRFAAGSGHAVLKGYEYLCRLWGRLPGNNQIWGRPRLGQVAAFYGILAAAAWMCRRGRRRRFLLLSVLSVFLLLPIPLCGLEVTFLDVGQGDGICIRTREETILVDGGSTDQKNLGKGRLEPFLKSKGIRSVDYAIVSHGDQDHISGLVWLMEQGDLRVENLILPAVGEGEEVYQYLASLALDQGGRVSWMKRGDCLLAGELVVTCLYPEEGACLGEDRNEHSLVLQVDYEEFHMLLTGDMSKDGEERLMSLEEKEKEERLAKVQVLKVAHHGSRYSTTSRWLDAVRPAWAVISYGEGNRYGHPGREVLEELDSRGIWVYETGKSGAVILRTNGKNIWWTNILGSQNEENVIE